MTCRPASCPAPPAATDVVAVRLDGTVPEGRTTVLRLLVRLPAHWVCEPLVEPDRIALRVRHAGVTAEEVRAALGRALRDPGLAGWAPSPPLPETGVAPPDDSQASGAPPPDPRSA